MKCKIKAQREWNTGQPKEDPLDRWLIPLIRCSGGTCSFVMTATKTFIMLNLRAQSRLQIKFLDTYSEVRFIKVPKELGRSPVRLLNDRSLAKSILFKYESWIYIWWWKTSRSEQKTHISLICNPENTFPRGPDNELWLKFLEDKGSPYIIISRKGKQCDDIFYWYPFGISHLQRLKRRQKR